MKRCKYIAVVALITISMIRMSNSDSKKSYNVVYNMEKSYYEVIDENTGVIKHLFPSNANYSLSKDKHINYFPYQEGWLVQTPSSASSKAPLTIGDLTGDNFSEVFARTYWDGAFVYDYLGNIISQSNWANWGYCSAFKDIDFDGINEIIGLHFNKAGAMVAKWNGVSLNGFPNPPETTFYGAVVEDIDRDGNYEIASGEFSIKLDRLRMYVLGSWGGLLPGFPVKFSCHNFNSYCGWPGSSATLPSVGDFDNDGIMELALYVDSAMLYLIRSNGSLFRNWPVGIMSHWVNPPALADIDNDEQLELAIPIDNIRKLFIFNSDGSIIKGFPVIYGNSGSYKSPSIADINDDGNLELYLTTVCNVLNAFNNDGTNLPGWPIHLKINGYEVAFHDFPKIVDIDDDDEMEIVAAGLTCEWCPDGVIVAFNFDDTMVEGFPIIEPKYNFNYLTIADLDADGDIELCAGSEYCDKTEHTAYIFCQDLPYKYKEDKIAWYRYANDNQHTCRYVNPAIKPPVIYSITPYIGSYKGGRIVEIKGENLLQGAKVFFGEIPSEYVQVADSKTIFAKVPPHKPCNMNINDTSVSPYELSEKLVNQPVINNSANAIKSMNSSGYIVNIVVVHPSPDQREGILRAGFTYTGYEAHKDDIVLKVSKYAPMGKFENNGANWLFLSDYGGLWNTIDDDLDCIKKPSPSGHIAMYYGNKKQCNYNEDGRTHREVFSPLSKVDRADAKVRFKYYRDVEYNSYRNADELSVAVEWTGWKIVWVKDSTEVSEKEWIQAEFLIGRWLDAETVRIIFIFDSKDAIDNNHAGVAIDNVELIGAHWLSQSENSGEVILTWNSGLPKYFVYRNESPDYSKNPPPLVAYAPFTTTYENTLNDDKSYYYKIR